MVNLAKRDGSTGMFPKQGGFPNKPMGFPTKNDQHLGWRLGVPLFLETPTGSLDSRVVSQHTDFGTHRTSNATFTKRNCNPGFPTHSWRTGDCQTGVRYRGVFVTFLDKWAQSSKEIKVDRNLW